MGLDMWLNRQNGDEIMYWRKANQIHGWFVENCQDGVDECQDTIVPREKLEELLEICKKVEANHELANELLPTTPGFFFGSYNYDEYYFEDLKETISKLEEELKNNTDTQYIYQSSW